MVSAADSANYFSNAKLNLHKEDVRSQLRILQTTSQT